MEKVFLKVMPKILIILIIVFAVASAAVSAALARSLAYPKGMTLAEEREWAKSNGVWGDLEDYSTEEYTVEGKDGYILHCELVNDESVKNNKRYVIISHGYNSNRYGAAKYVPNYIDLGYQCIIYDLRGHGENERSVNTVGNLESQDLVRLIDDTYTRFGSDIELGLHGESMGSSTSLSAMKYDPKVRFVVADCGFANLYELIGTGFRSAHVGFLEPLVNGWMTILYGVNMKETSAEDALDGCTVPICFIHGGDDSFITPDNSERLQKACSGYTELHIVDYAEHAKSRAVLGRSAYTAIISDFLDQVEKQEAVK